MSKLSLQDKFIDISDYGRPFATRLAALLKHTSATPVHITLVFGVCGLIAVYAILIEFFVTAAIFLILKSIIDAADGELARVKKSPSYTGRYLDSIFDFILNFLVITAIWIVTEHAFTTAFLAFFCLQLQGTLYNYYYVIQRHQTSNGDTTSKIFETEVPTAYPGENQKTVALLFRIYSLFYSLFDRLIYRIEPHAPQSDPFPKWFMTLLSIYGLGFQLLIISVMLAFGLINWIIPLLIVYTIFIFLFIAIRKSILSR
ncbi:CDP-alcohol phosphatidyltransferase [Rhodohalobacter sp. SW132]|uniref:CDP-alcohol phosphatidyltransferase family protein n=1 Tax=Rhodohalobacter sp. SW132 TaxID=2293433 RepID=UPI000E274FB6|nr:CDP-alcohol phosphatidyltransferase family protein [Rhodohalobacter sp. SW132]REL37714.1 CDP-alcohol phosphatidyltransferase [Rhodohalobacter sp. SW132]